MFAMLEDKKRDIVKFFLEKGILIDEDFLNKIKGTENLNELYSLLSEKLKSNNTFIINDDLNKILKHQETTTIDNNVKILFSYEEDEKKVEVQDFINFFNVRYETLRQMLQNRQELQNITSINRLSNKKDKSTVSIIGMVLEKQVTKNDNVMLTVEDPTGIIKVLISKSKPELIEASKNIVHDEVIGVVGVNGDNIIFANNIIYPDILTKELKKSNRESYAVFLSDIHVGSKYFLEEEFFKFLKWLKGETGNDKQKEIASKVDYVFITGDLVDGVGIYPEQDSELIIKDIYEQYKRCSDLLKQIPERIKIIICPGNHDAMRISEPQPKLYSDFAEAIWKLPNVVLVSNPALVNIASDKNFPGFDVLMYHGYSFDHYVAEVDSIRMQGGYDRADLIMKFLLQKRHLAPTHTSTLYLPNQKKDNLIISTVPDFFITGHIHKSAVKNYRGVTTICGSCWQSKTTFQEKVGHNPEPCKVPIVNLKTREVKILNFGK